MLGLDGIRNILNNTVQRFSSKVPDSMEPVFIPLDMNSLNVTIGSIIDNSRSVTLNQKIKPVEPSRVQLKEFQAKILNFIIKTYPNKVILTSGNDIFVNGKSGIPLEVILTKFTPAVVYNTTASKANIQGILFNKFNAAQAEFFDGFLNKEILSFLNKTLGTTLAAFEAGVIQSNPRAPIAQKVRLLSRVLNSFSKSTVNIKGVNAPADKASVFQTQLAVNSLLKTYRRSHRSGIDVEAVVIERVSAFVSSMSADIIIIQDAGVSQDVGAQVAASLDTRKIADMLSKTAVDGKRTFLQKIGDRIGEVFLGKKPRESTGAVKMQPIRGRKDAPLNVRSTSGKTSAWNFSQGTVSPADLVTILNTNLTQTVISNMGKGNPPSAILNNQTGTLAKSFKVENVAITRQGAITAFYSYARSPYGTFAEGGKQQNPRSRDPTRLADKSVRSIAAKNAITNLRTQVI